ncbi:MAG: tetratricopeptide repeat protein [Nitrospiraceae bacterium]|nr:MAG: tetratricopeptide repeat protein [Nitrospiraceae bacterium]
MSLLADLLSKVKQPQQAGEIPPHLKNIVEGSSKKTSLRKKIIVLSSIFIVAILSGFLLINFLDTFSSSSLQTQDTSKYSMNAGKRGTASGEHETIASEKSAPESATAGEETAVSPSPARATDLKPSDAADLAIRGNSETKDVIPEKNVREEEKKMSPPVHSTGTKKKRSGEAEIASLLYRARAFEMKKDYRHALENYKAVLARDKENFTVMNNIAYILLQLGNAEESLKYAGNALAIKNTYVPALVNLGIAQAKSDQRDAAEMTFQKAYSMAPENSSVLLNLAVLNERQNRYEQAAHYFSLLMNLGEKSGYTGLARVFEKQEKTGEAIDLYKQIALLESFDKKTRTEARQRAIILQSR